MAKQTPKRPSEAEKLIPDAISASDIHPGQLDRFFALRDAYRTLADTVLNDVPAGDDRDEALTHLRLSFVFVREGIARNPSAIKQPPAPAKPSPKPKTTIPDPQPIAPPEIPSADSLAD